MSTSENILTSEQQTLLYNAALEKIQNFKANNAHANNLTTQWETKTTTTSYLGYLVKYYESVQNISDTNTQQKVEKLLNLLKLLKA